VRDIGLIRSSRRVAFLKALGFRIIAEVLRPI
jgi:hypothetical protein